MINTIKHQDTGKPVVAAKLLTGYLSVNSKVANPESFIQQHQEFDAGFVAYILAWQSNRGLVSDGIIGPATWTAIAKAAPTCSTSKLRKSGTTLAVQLLLDGNLTADAIYGSRTKAAVAAFQAAAGLKADGICGPKTWNALIVGTGSSTPTASTETGGTTGTGTTGSSSAPTGTTHTPGTFVQPVDYKQGDSRWGKKMYSNHGDKSQTMANSACGPTAAANVVATLKDSTVTPWTLAQLAMEWGDRTYNNGTAWAFFKRVAERYGFVKFVQTATLAALKACLDAGGYAVASMGPGFWTKGGHFITPWKYDDKYIYCNDPASSTRKRQKITEFMAQRKQFFCYYPDEPIVETPPAEPTETTVPSTGTGSEAAPQVQRGTEIVDISKWQPTVDYDAFIKATALIILRAGYRGTGGSIKIDEKFVKHADALAARGVRFGVYFYSIADTEAKARAEAQAFIQYAAKYNPLFYALDAEKEQITHDAIAAFADELRKLGAKRVGCYVAHNHYKDYGYATLRDLFDFTWIPRYGSNTGTIDGAKKPSYKCDLWQYTSTGDIDGINGNVDKNTITGDGKSLEWFLGGE